MSDMATAWTPGHSITWTHDRDDLVAQISCHHGYECDAASYLRNDGASYRELYDGPDGMPVRSGPIEVRCNGHGYVWRYAIPINTIARIEVHPRPGAKAWPVVERVAGGWQSGGHHYPDPHVVAVTELLHNPTPT